MGAPIRRRLARAVPGLAAEFTVFSWFLSTALLQSRPYAFQENVGAPIIRRLTRAGPGLAAEFSVFSWL